MTGSMTHEGLPITWAVVVCLISAILILRALIFFPAKAGTLDRQHGGKPLVLIKNLVRSPWPQTMVRILVAMLFLLVIYAGIAGTPLPERNFATVVTWNLWWGGLVVLVLFAGTVWCGICPWDSLAQWLVRRRLWQRGSETSSLGLQPPTWMRNVWPAAIMFTGLTWLELGFGVTRSPYATAMLAVLMLVLATISMALYERKAFCRYICPVGRTLGVYSQLSPVALRPIKTDTCMTCTTLECYHGNEQSEPCPTRLVMGRLRQNTYCTSCGACIRSCPHDNISWYRRGMASEIKLEARPHSDEAGFMIILLALTSFHGLTMMPFWENGLSQLARIIGDSGALLWSFSLALLAFIVLAGLFFYLSVSLTAIRLPSAARTNIISRLAFVAVPLAFSYHLAHNVTHLARESRGAAAVWLNPAGVNTLPVSSHELHMHHMNPFLPEAGIHFLQAGLMVFGMYLAIEVLRHRISELYVSGSVLPGQRLVPMLVFIAGIAGFNLWMLMEPMVVRFQ